MGFFINFILERSRQRVNQINWQRRQLQPVRKRIVYLQPSGAQNKIPLFGSDISGFGMDWAATQSRSYKVAPTGPRAGVPKATINRSSSIVGLEPAHTSKPYEDPAISRTFKRTSKGTDQKVTKRCRSTITNWDGKVRNIPSRKSYLTTERKTEKREPEPSINQDPYSFY